MALTEKELEELKALEEDEKKEAAALEERLVRQRLEAKRARKRNAAKLGEFGLDFTVVMTTADNSNWVFRRCHDVELDGLGENHDDRAAQEQFLLGVTVEPTQEEAQRLLAKFPGLVNALVPAALSLVGQLRKEEAKK